MLRYRHAGIAIVLPYESSLSPQAYLYEPSVSDDYCLKPYQLIDVQGLRS
jgi:hypothetical protein